MALLFLIVSTFFFLIAISHGKKAHQKNKTVSRESVMRAVELTGTDDINKLLSTVVLMYKAEKFYIIGALVSLVGFVMLATQ